MEIDLSQIERPFECFWDDYGVIGEYTWHKCHKIGVPNKVFYLLLLTGGQSYAPGEWGPIAKKTNLQEIHETIKLVEHTIEIHENAGQFRYILNLMANCWHGSLSDLLNAVATITD